MKDKEHKIIPKTTETARIDEEWERKFFPHAHEMKMREKAMKDPVLYEVRLKEKLHRCIEKDYEVPASRIDCQ
jgi:hypothetical protein